MDALQEQDQTAISGQWPQEVKGAPSTLTRRGAQLKNARSLLFAESSGSYQSSVVTSPTASARTTSRTSASNVNNADTETSKEHASDERISLFELLSIDADKDIITDYGEALRADRWLSHQTFDDVQPKQPRETKIIAQPDLMNAGEDDSETPSIVISEGKYYHDLKHRLEAACVRNVDGQFFMPVDKVYELITRESVSEELQLASSRNRFQYYGKPPPLTRSIQQIANDVCPGHGSSAGHKWEGGESARNLSRRKIFGILVSIGMSLGIEIFLDDNVSDKDLPFTATTHDGTIQVTSSAGLRVNKLSDILTEHDKWLSRYMEVRQLSAILPEQDGTTQATSSAGSRVDKLRDILAEKDWHSSLVERFMQRQWEFVAPFFATRSSEARDGITHYKLSKETVFPWMSRPLSAMNSSRQGGFGKLSKVLIHPAHHSFGGNDRRSISTYFAIKTIPVGPGARSAFEREVSVLKRVSRLEDRHLSKLLSTYEQEGTYFMMFHWADGGNLRDMWSKNKQRPELTEGLMMSILGQLTGLAEGLTRIHNYELHAGGTETLGYRHGDLKPENILWFKQYDDDIQYPGNGLGTLVISAFGLSKDSKSVEETSIKATTSAYRPPEAELSDQASGAYNMWSLGCVLLEFMVWMNAGWDGVQKSFPSARTTEVDPLDAQSEPFLDNSFFTLEKGVARVKSTVSDWIDALGNDPRSTPWERDLLVVISTSLLVVNPEERMNATRLAQVLKEMQDWGRLHPAYFTPGAADDERTMTYPGLTDEPQDGSAVKAVQHRRAITSHEEKIQHPENEAEERPKTIRLNGMKLVPHSNVNRQISMSDKLRVAVEDYLDEAVDWWPLSPLQRPQGEQHIDLRWEYGGEEMSVILNQTGHDSEWPSFNQNQAQGHTTIGILPTVQPRSSQSNNDQISSKDTAREPFWKTWIQYLSQSLNTSKPNTPGPASSSGNAQMETYLCVDKCWTTIKDTRMRAVTALGDMDSDFEFFCRARDLLTQVEGNWLQRRLSWRSYTSVILSRFHFLWDDTDEVEVDGKPPPGDSTLFRGYQYTPIQDVSIDVQMRLCATILLKGIANPELGRDRRQLLDSMPKLLAPPGLNKKQFSGGWGFHARQGLSMRKTMGWVAVVLVFGIAFVPFWLCAIDELDVQTALAPASFLATVLGVGLAMLAIAHTR